MLPSTATATMMCITLLDDTMARTPPCENDADTPLSKPGYRPHTVHGLPSQGNDEWMVSGCDVMNEGEHGTVPTVGRARTIGKRRPAITSPQGEGAVSVTCLQEGQRSDWHGKPRRTEKNVSRRLCDDGLSEAGSRAQRDRPWQWLRASGTAPQWQEPAGRSTSSFPALHDLPHHCHCLGTIPGTRSDRSPGEGAIPCDDDRGRKAAHHKGP